MSSSCYELHSLKRAAKMAKNKQSPHRVNVSKLMSDDIDDTTGAVDTIGFRKYPFLLFGHSLEDAVCRYRHICDVSNAIA